MKILSIIERVDPDYGGPAVSLPSLLIALNAKYDVNNQILSTSTFPLIEKNELIAKGDISSTVHKTYFFEQLKFSPGLLFDLLVKSKKCDIIYSNNLWNFVALFSYLASKLNRKPHVISCRGSIYPWSLSIGKYRKKIAWSLFQKKAFQDAAFIHVTALDEYEAVRALGIKTDVVISPHGIDSEEFNMLPERKDSIVSLKLNSEKRYFLFMSRLHKKKGLDLLLDLWNSIAHLYPNWVLLVVGPDYGNYIKLMDRYCKDNLGEQLLYLGCADYEIKKQLFSVSEFFVLPSYTENFGIVIGEALSAGLPVITTKNTPWEIINDKDCGKCINLSASELEQALTCYLGKNTDFFEVRGLVAKELIRNNYSWYNRCDSFYSACSDVLNK